MCFQNQILKPCKDAKKDSRQYQDSEQEFASGLFILENCQTKGLKINIEIIQSAKFISLKKMLAMYLTFVSPLSLYAESLISKIRVFGDGACGR